ncbi:MAG: hypothetical protein KatS3mg111_1854 [Pirellulaceae bacterium]|nr:MAG: hypothetical protein KatS3mg111_1854 [Pirellulaceae bacterium]
MGVIDKQKPLRAAFGDYEVRPVLLIRRSRGGLLKTGQGQGMTLTSHKRRLQSRHTAGTGCRQPSGQGNQRVFEFSSFAFTLI